MPSLVVTVSVAPDMPRGEIQARTRLRNLEGVARLQRLCDRFGVQPSWLLAWPVITAPAASIFDGFRGRELLDACYQFSVFGQGGQAFAWRVRHDVL